MEFTEKKNARVSYGFLLHALVAALCALILLTLTGFGIFKLASLSAEADTANLKGSGRFVELKVDKILGIYADEYDKKSGEAISWYALVPIDGELVTVVLPKRYFDSADTILAETGGVIDGSHSNTSQYFTVRGTTAELTEDEYALFDDWFSGNRAWVNGSGLLPDAADYSDSLSPLAVRADNIGGYPQSVVFALTALAGVFIIYALIALALSVFIRPESSKADAPAADTYSAGDTDTGAADSASGDTDAGDTDAGAADSADQAAVPERDDDGV